MPFVNILTHRLFVLYSQLNIYYDWQTTLKIITQLTLINA